MVTYEEAQKIARTNVPEGCIAIPCPENYPNELFLYKKKGDPQILITGDPKAEMWDDITNLSNEEAQKIADEYFEKIKDIQRDDVVKNYYRFVETMRNI